MEEYLRRVAVKEWDDWIKNHVVAFFHQIAQEISLIIERNLNPFALTITIWDLQNILSRYPGSQRGKSYKLWRGLRGRELDYTPPDITKDQLIEFSERLLRVFGREGITAESLWKTPERYRNLVITATAIFRLLKKVPLVETPTEVKLQLKEPEESVVWAVLTGIFYRRPHPNEPPFVEVGDIVEEGQPFCILEANKVFNTILAERRMRILEIVARDENLVQEGDILFRVEILEETGTGS